MDSLKEPQSQGRPLAATPLDEAVWQAWLAKGRASDRRNSAARVKAMQWASVAGLLTAAALWSHLAGFEVAVRLLVTSGALIVMFQAFRSEYLAVAAAFAALAILY